MAGVTRATIYNWVNSGKIPAINFGGTVVINRHELEKYLEVRKAYFGGAVTNE
jgi:excisionase family DNA binding protein